MPRSVGNATEQNNAGSGKKRMERTLFQLTFHTVSLPCPPSPETVSILPPCTRFSILGQTSLLCRGGTPACRGNGLLQARGTGPHPQIGQAAQGIPDGLLPGKSRVSPARAAGGPIHPAGRGGRRSHPPGRTGRLDAIPWRRSPPALPAPVPEAHAG